MTSIEYITLEVADPTTADRFYTQALGLGKQVRVRASEAIAAKRSPSASSYASYTSSSTPSRPSAWSRTVPENTTTAPHPGRMAQS